ncbi:hypothetical protein DFH08DRAFT_960744 [Mycena albidolilacea]|uniref:Uncharacterized protein n=1 Tax=Mycena albidolilacea TaxID=1033008 RepID=A0AAD7ES53_9AGAR|nr:hypothetical protein DFH08DRAFT_960744 [Mycena albidolilacea]
MAPRPWHPLAFARPSPTLHTTYAPIASDATTLPPTLRPRPFYATPPPPRRLHAHPCPTRLRPAPRSTSPPCLSPPWIPSLHLSTLPPYPSAPPTAHLVHKADTTQTLRSSIPSPSRRIPSPVYSINLTLPPPRSVPPSDDLIPWSSPWSPTR